MLTQLPYEEGTLAKLLAAIFPQMESFLPVLDMTRRVNNSTVVKIWRTHLGGSNRDTSLFIPIGKIGGSN
ncbi:hypothetical protein PIB30_003683 [Stylosanthes scabra]|uniref:Uncharacterized protein n=1 Tax=Stylosanthes scabra TaxID=79078 RepID=A0ABU6Z5H5_9FABA|nr:hypothetical protein [Stylosanthes scabra]